MKANRSSEGFSLLEMLVVLAIISMTATVLFGAAVLHKPSGSINVLGQEILHLVEAQSLRAISMGRTASVEVNMEKRQISAPGSRPAIRIPDQIQLVVLTGAELVQQDKTGVIEFYADGSSSGGEITLLNAEGAKRAVRVNWLTGAVSLKGMAGP